MIKFLKNLFFSITIPIFLVGCGFTIHNTNSLPPQLNPIYYQTKHPYEPFEIAFKKRLKTAGIKLLSEPDESTLIINISSNYSDNASNITSSTQARIYNLDYTATITISDFCNKQLLSPQTVTVSRNITLQPNEVFKATPQIAIIKQEMQQELTTKILNILSAPKTFQALETWTKTTTKSKDKKR